MFQLEMPRETRIVWNEGEPAGAIVTAAAKEGVDLLIAGALEGKDVASRSFLGAVARPLAKLARCSLLLLTHPQVGPNPFRRIVVITDFSDVVPAPEHVEGAVPSMMDWALQVTPCSLWIVRES